MLGVFIDDRCISGLDRSLGRNKDTEVCIRIILYKLLSVAKCVEIPEESNSYFSLFNTCLSKLAKVKPRISNIFIPLSPDFYTVSLPLFPAYNRFLSYQNDRSFLSNAG